MPRGHPDDRVPPAPGSRSRSATVLAASAFLLIVGVLALVLVGSLRRWFADFWTLPAILLAELLPFLLPLLVRRMMPDLPSSRGPSADPVRRGLLLAGVFAAGSGAAVLSLGALLAARGMAGAPYLIAGGAGLALGTAVIAFCGKRWGVRFLLAEALREPGEAGPAPPLGAEALHVRVLALLGGLASAGAGTWIWVRDRGISGQAATLLVLGGLLIGAAATAFLRTPSRRGRRPPEEPPPPPGLIPPTAA